MVFDELDQKILGLMEKFDFQNLTTIRNGLGGPNKNTPRPPPRESEKLGGGLDPPPRESEKLGGGQSQKS